MTHPYALSFVGLASLGLVAGTPPEATGDRNMEPIVTSQDQGPRSVMPPPRADFDERQEQLIHREFNLILAKDSDDALRQFAARFPATSWP